MNILGISAYYHDSSAVLLSNGNIVAAVQEERFTRVKHDSSFPRNSIAYCLSKLKDGENVDHVVFYEKPFLKFERLLETYLSFAPRGFRSFAKSMPIWAKQKLFQKKIIIDELKKIDKKIEWKKKLLFSEHHISHAASAYFPSPFDEAVILTMDGVGEWSTTTVALGKSNNIDILKEIKFPSSLGLFYSAFTQYTGFKVNSGEYKVMGLAPYGEPIYADLIKGEIIDIKADGSFRLNQRYFNYCTGLTMVNSSFEKLLGEKTRLPHQPITQFHMDIAASVQLVTEEVILKVARSLADEYKIPNLCLAGGVALNCVANGKLISDGCFPNIWIQPAAGDAGGALGAALITHYSFLKNTRKANECDSMKGALLGPSFTQKDCESRLKSVGAVFRTFDSEDDLLKEVVQQLANGQAVGWHQGRAEFGPRALGARSILGDPRSPSMQKTLNLKVKFRESFRPFAPSILEESLSDYFNINVTTPYMLFVSDVKFDKRLPEQEGDSDLVGLDRLNVERSVIPAVTHVDFSARIQSVNEKLNPRYYKLLKKFNAKTGCPILVNTSFNIRGEPIVQTPEDAYRCFMGTDIDVLVVGDCFLTKTEQNSANGHDYRNEFELD